MRFDEWARQSLAPPALDDQRSGVARLSVPLGVERWTLDVSAEGRRVIRAAFAVSPVMRNLLVLIGSGTHGMWADFTPHFL